MASQTSKTAAAEGSTQKKSVASRRSFLMSSSAGAGAFVAGVVANGEVRGALAKIPSITIPQAFTESMNQEPKEGAHAFTNESYHIES